MLAKVGLPDAVPGSRAADGEEPARPTARAWYVCSCGTVMPAKQWLRRFEDQRIGSWKLRWYCVCGTSYKTKFGMLVEIHIKNPEPTSTFMLAEIPDFPVDDVRGMYLEHTQKPKDHRDLWLKIPDFKPMELGDILRPCKESEFYIHDGFDKALIYKFINPAGLNGLPKWDWDPIFFLMDDSM